jgi:peroxiredoxin
VSNLCLSQGLHPTGKIAGDYKSGVFSLRAKPERPKPGLNGNVPLLWRSEGFRCIFLTELSARMRFFSTCTLLAALALSAGNLGITFATEAGSDAATAQSVLGRRVKSFELSDFQGQPHRLDDWKASPAVVVVFLGTECPLAQQYAPRLQQLADRFAKQNVAVVVINSNQQDSLSEMAHFAKMFDLKMPLLKDVGNKVADQFHAERTPEAFVLDGDRVVVYRGRVDDQFTYGRQRPQVQHEYVAEAVEAVLAGMPVAIAETEAHGCHIGRMLEPDEASKVTYSNQIVRIFQKHCVACHREGEVGPFALTNYEEVVGWAEMIREVTSDQRMPPWHADAKHGKFANDRRLSDEEKRLIEEWVAAGAPQGDVAQLPPPREFTTGWQIGEPDAVFYIAEQPVPVPAQGEVKYQYFTVDPKFTEDKWVQAAECRADRRSVVHHIIVGLIPLSGGRQSQGSVHSEWLTAAAPGASPLVLRPGYAKLIPAGSKLVFQMHYTPNGKPQFDRSCVGLKFADPKTVKKQVGTEKAATNKFEIPPGASSHPVAARHRFDRDSLVLAMFPHMHLRGKSFRYTLVYPDERHEILLDVPHYDFNWQNGYELAEPKFVPAGSQMFCEATFDNSDDNVANPDPTQAVRWGDQTWEEMMIGYFDMALADQDLTQAQPRRTEAFLKQARAGNASLAQSSREQGRGALASGEKWEAFGLELRKTVPQLDRICWSSVTDGKLTIQQVAQQPGLARLVPAGNAGRQVDAGLSKLAALAREAEVKVYDQLGQEPSIDLQYMAKAFAASLHVPREIGGQPATVNFWSTEGSAFPPEAVRLLEEAAAMLTSE